MEAKHTLGLLFVSESKEHWGRVNCHLTSEVDQANIGSIWVNGTAQNRADARRIVACWNACEGIDTEMLEADGYGENWSEIAAHRIELMQQSADLLEVLKAIIRDGVHCNVVPHLHERAMAAIAKATVVQP